MTTYKRAKLDKSDDQTNIVKYRLAANITEYHSKIQFKNVKNGRTDLLVSYRVVTLSTLNNLYQETAHRVWNR